MQMKNLAVFPYHPDVDTLIANKHDMERYEISGIISYKEDWHLLQRLNSLLGLENVSEESIIQRCDVLLLLDDYRGFSLDKYYRVLDAALALQKDVFITPLAESQLNLEDYKGKYQLLEKLPDAVSDFAERSESGKVSKLHDIDIPIIAVGGVGKNCGKFKNQLILRSVLNPEYNIKVITSNSLGALFGCYTMPSIMFENREFQEKIFEFNRFVESIASADDNDALVIGIPEGILQFEREEFHHFSEYPLIISASAAIDFVILCTYFMDDIEIDVFEDSLKDLSAHCEDKFNMQVGAIAISTVSCVVSEEDGVVFEYLDDEFVRQYYPKQANSSFLMLTKENDKQVIGEIITRLQENVDAI